MLRKILITGTIALAAISIAGCTAADVASRNTSLAADNFEVRRLIVGVNGITGEALFSVDGYCSITGKMDGASDSNPQANALVVTCKEGDGQFKKHYLGLSDNTIWTATQLEPHRTSEFRTRIIYRPTAVVPDLDLSVGI